MIMGMLPLRVACLVVCLLAGAAPVSAQDAPAALYAQAMALSSGDTSVPDMSGAAVLLEPAAEAGYAPAQNLLAKILLEGGGGEQDRPRAVELFRAAAAEGDPAHLLDYARVLEPDTPVQAAALYAQAAQAGSVEAAVSLGVLYQSGTGVAQDFEQARVLYAAAAEAGHPRGLNNLGLLYVRGTGVAQDYARAAELFRAAADAGLRPAMSNLATLYINGFGVPLDEARADALYRAAANPDDVAPPAGDALYYDPRLAPPDDSEEGAVLRQQAAQAGDPVALYQTGWLVMRRADAEADPTQRLRLEIAGAEALEAAAQKGFGPAMAHLAVLYHNGRGRAQDYMLGQMWLWRAHAAGVPGVDVLIARFAPKLTLDQRRQAQDRARGAETTK